MDLLWKRIWCHETFESLFNVWLQPSVQAETLVIAKYNIDFGNVLFVIAQKFGRRCRLCVLPHVEHAIQKPFPDSSISGDEHTFALDRRRSTSSACGETDHVMGQIDYQPRPCVRPSCWLLRQVLKGCRCGRINGHSDAIHLIPVCHLPWDG